MSMIKHITIHDIPFLTKIADMSRFVSRFVMFSNCKNCKSSNISNPTVFAGGASSWRWGRAGPSRRRVTQPAPGPASNIFKIRGPIPTRSARFQFHATSARPCRRGFNLTGRLPGLARNSLRMSSLFLRAVSSSSRFRGSHALVTLGPAASLRSRSLSTIGI